MNEFLHHVPGRIRRARLFRSERSNALRHLWALPPVRNPRLNDKAGSVTVLDPAEIGKVALSMLVNKGVSYSLSTLLRTRF